MGDSSKTKEQIAECRRMDLTAKPGRDIPPTGGFSGLELAPAAQRGSRVCVHFYRVDASTDELETIRKIELLV